MTATTGTVNQHAPVVRGTNIGCPAYVLINPLVTFATKESCVLALTCKYENVVAYTSITKVHGTYLGADKRDPEKGPTE
jgi:hypothetical protein